MFVAFASLNSEIKADAATLPENIVSGYSGENFRPINGEQVLKHLLSMLIKP